MPMNGKSEKLPRPLSVALAVATGALIAVGNFPNLAAAQTANDLEQISQRQVQGENSFSTFAATDMDNDPKQKQFKGSDSLIIRGIQSVIRSNGIDFSQMAFSKDTLEGGQVPVFVDILLGRNSISRVQTSPDTLNMKNLGLSQGKHIVVISSQPFTIPEVDINKRPTGRKLLALRLNLGLMTTADYDMFMQSQLKTKSSDKDPVVFKTIEQTTPENEFNSEKFSSKSVNQ